MVEHRDENNSSDQVFGGFTLIAEKTKPRLDKIREILPFWIVNSSLFSNDLKNLQSVQEIDKINPFICERLKEMGINNTFPVQSCVIPYILKCYRISKRRPLCRPRDVCICAPTGSGKTLSYAVPIVQLLLNREHRFLRALIILPVRDLALQVYKIFKQLIEGTNLEVCIAAGLQSFTKEQSDLVESKGEVIMSKADILVATPGRLVDHLYNTSGFSTERLRFLVIDEADRVISEEKQDWYHALEESMYNLCISGYDNSSEISSQKRRRLISSIEHHYDISNDITLQKILVSATLTHDPEPLKQFNLYFPRLFTSNFHSFDKLPKSDNCEENGSFDFNQHAQLSSKQIDDEVTISMDVAGVGNNHSKSTTLDSNKFDEKTCGVGLFTTPLGLKEFVVSVSHRNRALFLLHLVRHKHMKRILVFANSRSTTERLNLLMSNFHGIGVSSLSAAMPLEKRERILGSFIRGNYQLLICTDSMARGMDIPDVECVVCYEAPTNVKTYVHRVGRTARAGKSGVAYTLLERNQFHFFKRDLKKVGKNKIREIPFHLSQISDFLKEYKKVLDQMEIKSEARFSKTEFCAASKHLSTKRKVSKTMSDNQKRVNSNSVKENSSVTSSLDNSNNIETKSKRKKLRS